jgi:hypothetical protein
MGQNSPLAHAYQEFCLQDWLSMEDVLYSGSSYNHNIQVFFQPSCNESSSTWQITSGINWEATLLCYQTLQISPTLFPNDFSPTTADTCTLSGSTLAYTTSTRYTIF